VQWVPKKIFKKRGGIIQPSLAERAKCIALQSEVEVKLQPKIKFAL
jgi:hypothetical protein